MKHKEDHTDWLDETSTYLVEETLKIIRECPKPKSKGNLTEALVHAFIQKFLEDLLDKSLRAYEDSGLNSQDAYEATQHSYLEFKTHLQNIICQAFENITSEFSNNFIDYTCSIAPVGKPINKEPC